MRRDFEKLENPAEIAQSNINWLSVIYHDFFLKNKVQFAFDTSP